MPARERDRAMWETLKSRGESTPDRGDHLKPMSGASTPLPAHMITQLRPRQRSTTRKLSKEAPAPLPMQRARPFCGGLDLFEQKTTPVSRSRRGHRCQRALQPSLGSDHIDDHDASLLPRRLALPDVSARGRQSRHSSGGRTRSASSTRFVTTIPSSHGISDRGTRTRRRQPQLSRPRRRRRILAQGPRWQQSAQALRGNLQLRRVLAKRYVRLKLLGSHSALL